MAITTKMEGLLAWWALDLQEFDFRIVYRKGTLHGNADALSRRTPHYLCVSAATSCVPPSRDELRHQQKCDPHIQVIGKALTSNEACSPALWQPQPLRRYAQLWYQLTIIDGVVLSPVSARSHLFRLPYGSPFYSQSMMLLEQVTYGWTKP